MTVNTLLQPITDAEWLQLVEVRRELRQANRDELFIPVARLQYLYLINALKSMDDEGQIKETKRFTRGVAYNLASFTWPGWNDSYEISPEMQALGLGAARAGLQLAKEIDDINPTILWINGVHEMNARNHAIAIDRFKQAQWLASSKPMRVWYDAWIILTERLRDDSVSREDNWSRTIEQLKTMEFEDSEFYIEQLENAAIVYLEN